MLANTEARSMSEVSSMINAISRSVKMSVNMKHSKINNNVYGTYLT